MNKRSNRFYVDMGIKVDESLGYYDCIGYRAGIAGPYRPYDAQSGQALPLVEVPMVFMEGALVGQYPSDPAEAFERHLRHVAVVGGAVSLLFHPGQFHNPSTPKRWGFIDGCWVERVFWVRNRLMPVIFKMSFGWICSPLLWCSDIKW